MAFPSLCPYQEMGGTVSGFLYYLDPPGDTRMTNYWMAVCKSAVVAQKCTRYLLLYL